MRAGLPIAEREHQGRVQPREREIEPHRRQAARKAAGSDTVVGTPIIFNLTLITRAAQR
jgi:hypothetical protein